MGIIENYKNLFMEPAEFTSSVLDEGWPWWAYALIVAAWNLPGVAMALVVYGLLLGWIAIPIALVTFLIPFLGVLIMNAPFKKDTSWSEIFQVNLAFIAYATPVYTVLYLFMLLMLAISIFISSFIPVIFAYLILIVAAIWLTVSLFRALAELHMTSPWKMFLWVVAIGAVLSMIIYASVFAFLNAVMEEKHGPSDEKLRKMRAEDVTKELRADAPEAEIQTILERCDKIGFEDWLCKIQVAERIASTRYERALEICNQLEDGKEKCIQSATAKNPDIDNLVGCESLETIKDIRECYVSAAPAMLNDSQDINRTVYDFITRYCNQLTISPDDPESDEDERCIQQFARVIADANEPWSQEYALKSCNWIANSPNPEWGSRFDYRFDCYANTNTLHLLKPEDIIDYCQSKPRENNCLSSASATYASQNQELVAFKMCTLMNDNRPIYYDFGGIQDCYLNVWESMAPEDVLNTCKDVNTKLHDFKYGDLDCMVEAARIYAERGNKEAAMEVCRDPKVDMTNCGQVIAHEFVQNGELELAKEACKLDRDEQAHRCLNEMELYK